MGTVLSNLLHSPCIFSEYNALAEKWPKINKSTLSLQVLWRPFERKGEQGVCKDAILPGYSIETFLGQRKGWQADTRQSYRRALYDLQKYLAGCGSPPDLDALQAWQQEMQRQGYYQSSINLRITAANLYFRWCGRYDLITRHMQGQKSQAPELTRGEYLQLLRAARAQGRYRLYLLVKLFATTGMPLQCLEQITAQFVRTGSGQLRFRDEEIELHLPHDLQKELQGYIQQRGITEGPVFVTRSGKVISRSNICRAMRELCRTAGVPPEKGNPRALRHLFQNTRKELYSDVERLVQRAYEQLLETEQSAIGWTGVCG